MPPLIADFKKAALDLIFPKWCVGCGKEGQYICDTCRQTLPVINPPICPQCGRPVPATLVCENCHGPVSMIDGIRAPFLFEGIIRQAIHEFKYRNLRALAPGLTGLLYEYLIDNPIPADVLVPVPLHRLRLKERGYNQSALIASELSKRCNLPVMSDCLERRKYVRSQARSSNVTERQDNVAGAFTCRDDRLKGKQALLIDDVSTSGATMSACADVLKANGVKTVWGLVLALEL